MTRSKFWSASITMSIIIVMVSAYGIFGLVLGQESRSSEGASEHGGRSGGECAAEHGGGSEGGGG